MLKKILKKIKKKLTIQKIIYCNILTCQPNEKLKDKKIVITGGGSGIGYAIAKKSVQEGADVVIMGRRKEKLQNVSNELGRHCKYYIYDITDFCGENCLMEDMENLLGGPITTFINNAGIYINKPEGEYTLDDFTRTIDTNLRAPFFLTQSYIRYCKNKQINGNVIMIASNRALFGDYGPYGIAKSGLVNAVMGFARQSIKSHIRVNAVAPGMTASEINNIDAKGNMFTTSSKGNRILLPDEIAEVVNFLACDCSACITGAVIPCDEGDRLR